jgi:hypothetical protein
MSGFFRRFILGDFGPPPPPDLPHQPAITGQNVVEILYSTSKRERAVITCDLSGTYQIHIQFWDTSDWKAGHTAHFGMAMAAIVSQTALKLLAALHAKI